jgi:hypothetical protein
MGISNPSIDVLLRIWFHRRLYNDWLVRELLKREGFNAGLIERGFARADTIPRSDADEALRAMMCAPLKKKRGRK